MVSSDFFTESDTSGAVYASIHVGHHERTYVFVLHCPLVLFVPACVVAVVVRVVLKIALASLVANGTVEGVIGK